jgi:hypothetical protein
MNILAIDPGNIESAYVVVNENLKPLDFDKVDNEDLIESITSGDFSTCNHVVIEMIASYGMAVGKEVFETCVYIGRLYDSIERFMGPTPIYIYRKDEKMNLCHSMKAKDSNIVQALVDRFAYGVRNYGKGTKKEKGWFYGFRKDIWQSYAVAVTYHDMYLNKAVG